MSTPKKSRLKRSAANWRATAVQPRLDLLRIIPQTNLRYVFALIGLNVLLALLPVGFIFATSAVVGAVPEAVAGGVGSAAWTQLVRSFLLAAALFIGQQCAAPFQTYFSEKLRRDYDGRQRDRIMADFLAPTGIAALESPGVQDSLENAVMNYESDWSTIGHAVAGTINLLGRYLRLIAFCIILSVVMGWWAGLAAGTLTMIFRYGQRGGTRKYSQVWTTTNQAGRRIDYFRDLIASEKLAKEARVFSLVPWLTKQGDAAYWHRFRQVAHARRKVYLWPYLVYTSIGVVIAVGLLAALAHEAASGQVTLGALALALQAITGALLLGEHYAESDTATQFGMLSATGISRLNQEITKFGERFPDAHGTDSVPGEVPVREIRFEDVHFTYPGESQPVLTGLNLTLPVGRSTAIVGVNGAGKTTLVKLLTGLYQPTAGRITADGIDISTFSPEQWRRKIGVIFQDFIQFEQSAAYNIASGALRASDAGAPSADVSERIRTAADRAGILPVLESLPLGLDTPLSRAYEHGTDLSGGQWQRVAIARTLFALYSGAHMLVLDEPTSALDVRAEAQFFDQFVDLTAGAGSLLISHRFSSVRRAEQIVVIDGGKVIEQGSHEELMADPTTHYSRLFHLQAQRFARGQDADGNLVEDDISDSNLVDGDISDGGLGDDASIQEVTQ